MFAEPKVQQVTKKEPFNQFVFCAKWMLSTEFKAAVEEIESFKEEPISCDNPADYILTFRLYIDMAICARHHNSPLSSRLIQLLLLAKRFLKQYNQKDFPLILYAAEAHKYMLDISQIHYSPGFAQYGRYIPVNLGLSGMLLAIESKIKYIESCVFDVLPEEKQSPEAQEMNDIIIYVFVVMMTVMLALTQHCDLSEV